MYLDQFQYSFEKDTVSIFGSILVGASGAVTSAQGGGCLSVVKEATAGKYTITLKDRFSRLLEASAVVLAASVSPVASVQQLATPATYQATFKSAGQVVLQCVDYAGAAVNPASGDLVTFKIVVRKTSVGPFDDKAL